jgi:hypothetical protein
LKVRRGGGCAEVQRSKVQGFNVSEEKTLCRNETLNVGFRQVYLVEKFIIAYGNRFQLLFVFTS